MRILETSSTSERVVMDLCPMEIDIITWALDIVRQETRIDERSRDDFQELYECFGCIGTYRAISDIVAETGEEG